MSVRKRTPSAPRPETAPIDRVGHVICRAFHAGRCSCGDRDEHACEAARRAASAAVRLVDELRAASIEVVP